MVCVENNEDQQEVPLEEVTGKLKTVDPECSTIKEAKMLGTALGDEQGSWIGVIPCHIWHCTAKWRPTTFEGCKRTGSYCPDIKNQITSGRIGHAYLFCGNQRNRKNQYREDICQSGQL